MFLLFLTLLVAFFKFEALIYCFQAYFILDLLILVYTPRGYWIEVKVNI